MRKILLLATIFFTCNSAIGQTHLDPSFGNNGIARAFFPPRDNISYNQCEQVISKADGSFYFLLSANQQIFLSHRFANGTIDLNYGEKGYSVSFLMYGARAALLPNGKMIVGCGGPSTNDDADIVIVSYNADGSLDKTFADSGKQTIDFSGRDFFGDVMVQPDGKILVVGSYGEGSGFAIARLNEDGNLDNSFAGDGKQTTFLSGIPLQTHPYALAMGSDGRIIVAGRSEGETVVTAYLPSGEADYSFGVNGVAKFVAVAELEQLRVVSVQTDGKILIVGTTGSGAGIYHVTILRLNYNGTPDISFSEDGKEIIDLPRNETVEDVTIDGDEKILISGTISAGPDVAMVARFTTDGLPDKSFSEDGIATIDMNSYSAGTSSIQANGKVMIAGTYSAGVGRVFFAGRFNTDGTPDNSLDNDGLVTDFLNLGRTDFFASAIQPDGKIVCVGTAWTEAFAFDFVVARFNSDGSLDTGFSQHGWATIRFEPGAGGTNLFGSEADAVAIQPNGKIVVVGTTNGLGDNFAIARLNPDGSLDSSFSEDGKVTTDLFGANDYAYAVAIQPDGKIIVGGSSAFDNEPYTKYYFSLVRYNIDGSLDNSFSWDGKQTTEFFSPSDKISKLIVQPDGKILAIGSAGPRSVFYSTFGDFALVRYLPNGYADNTFGYSGAIRIDVQGWDDKAADAIRLQDGSILVAGTMHDWVSTNTHFAIVKLHPNGFIDSSFATNGRQVIPLGFVSETCNAIAIQFNGEIVLGGIVSNSSQPSQADDIALVRLFGDGTIDNSLSFSGKNFLDLGSNEERISSINIANNRIYAVGSSSYRCKVGFVLAFRLDCSLTATIPDAYALPIGVEPNTVYKGYAPAENITLMAMANGKFPFTYLWNTGATTKYIRVSPNTTATYDVTVTDASSCSQRISKTVNVVDVRCGNKNEKVLVCELEKGKWSKRKTVCVDPWMATLLLWKGSHLGPCPSDGLSSPNITSAIEEETNTFALHASPNPTHDQFALDINLNQPTKAELIITDMQGRVVERRFVNSSSLIRAGADYPAGIYMAELRQGEQRQVIKLVKLSR